MGPYFAYGLVSQQYGYPFTQVVSGTIAGEGQRISIIGQVFDGKDEPISDALIEIWQPKEDSPVTERAPPRTRVTLSAR